MPEARKMENRAQIAINDALMGFFIFLIIALTLNSLWLEQFSTTDSLRTTTGMQLQAASTTSLMIKTKGDPENWETTIQKAGQSCNNEDSVKIVGLAKTENSLDPAKVQQFIDCITYSRSVSIMMLERYDYNFTLSLSDGRAFSKGIPLSDKRKKTIMTKRFVDFNGIDANLSFALIEK